MKILLLTAVFFGIAMLAMAVGLIANRRLRGSCGGPGAEDCLCDIEKQRECRRRKHKGGAQSDIIPTIGGL